MRTRIAQLSMSAVALLIGLLLVGQLRSQARPTEISSLSAQDLSTLIETLSDRNRELRSGVSDVREQLREYRLAQTQGQSALDVSREDLRRIAAFSGLESSVMNVPSSTPMTALAATDSAAIVAVPFRPSVAM